VLQSLLRALATLGRASVRETTNLTIARVELTRPPAPGDECEAQPQGQAIDRADAPHVSTGLERRARWVLLFRAARSGR